MLRSLSFMIVMLALLGVLAMFPAMWNTVNSILDEHYAAQNQKVAGETNKTVEEISVLEQNTDVKLLYARWFEQESDALSEYAASAASRVAARLLVIAAPLLIAGAIIAIYQANRLDRERQRIMSKIETLKHTNAALRNHYHTGHPIQHQQAVGGGTMPAPSPFARRHYIDRHRGRRHQ